MSTSPRPRRPFVVTLAAAATVIQIVLVALVLLGMVTGLHQGSARGDASPFAVVLVQALGVLALTVLGRGLYTCARRRRLVPVAGWLGYSAAIWMLWAIVRVGEYSG